MTADVAEPSTTSRHVTLNDGRRHHYVAVEGEGPTLVFLHGYTDSWRSFAPLLPALAGAGRLLLLDQRGHGLSERAERYAIADFTGDAIAFIEAVVGGPVHLVGHSLGSIVAHRVAAIRPDLVESLILIGPARTAAGHPGLAELDAELAALGEDIPPAFVTAFQRGTTHREIGEADLAAFVSESLRLHPDTWRGALAGLVNDPDVPDTVLDRPALLLWGDRDAVFDRGAQADLARHLERPTAIDYPEVGHAPHWEIPDRVAADIRDFIGAPAPRGDAAARPQKDLADAAR
ncbi:alpha/beta fold hydrolase [Segnochrobactrum spirostomi]|uniref:alpha/beta fold hydrolase n=1 Tax=Segnochrobactrum spirostomi TaxID=2608987 RepID=UPI001AD7E749|nr:alpha/beta hydrolase [Segnochrobactrum spirostomi]